MSETIETTPEEATQELFEAALAVATKRPRGRPKGSKNKPKDPNAPVVPRKPRAKKADAVLATVATEEEEVAVEPVPAHILPVNPPKAKPAPAAKVLPVVSTIKKVRVPIQAPVIADDDVIETDPDEVEE